MAKAAPGSSSGRVKRSASPACPVQRESLLIPGQRCGISLPILAAEVTLSVRQFLRYGSVGVVATSAHYLLLVWSVERAGWPAWIGSGVGAVLGAQLAYFGNRWFTFSHKGGLGMSWIRFQAVALAGAVLGMALVAGAVRAGLHYVLAQMMATALILLLTFLVNRNWTFG